jgi:hypothetical protein
LARVFSFLWRFDCKKCRLMDMDAPVRHILGKPAGVALLVFLALPGCDHPASVELVDNQIQTPEVELLNEPVSALLGMADIDSLRLFPPEYGRTFGHMLISGSVYDGLFLHKEATLARAIFFDRSAPVLSVRGETLSYKTIDVGSLTVDGYDLRKHDKRVTATRPPVDSLLGVQYSLVNTGGPGLGYGTDHAYRWRNPETTLPDPLDVSVILPERLVVTEPAPSAKVSRAKNLTVKWHGGGSVVTIEVTDVVNALRPVPILHLRIARNRGEAVIPSTIMRLLPTNRKGFLFTFSSDRSGVQRISGYPDDVLVQGTTNHSLYFECTP